MKKMVSLSAKLRKITSIAVIGFVFFAAAGLPFIRSVQAASAPNIIGYQGRLLNANGVPVTDASLNMIFEFYDADVGGTCVWSNSSATCATATARAVTLTDGLFSENLGDVAAAVPYAAIGDSIFGDNATLYLQVTVDGETLTPRKQLVAAPYALNADTLDGADSSTFVTATGDTVTGDFDASGAIFLGASPLVFEGLSDDANQTTFAFTDPTGANTITFKDESGTVAYLADIAASGSKWTDSGTITYVTSQTDDIAVGGTTLIASAFAVDESANTVYIGEGANSDGAMIWKASDAATGTVTYTTSDRWEFTGGSLFTDGDLAVNGGDITTTATTWNFDVGNTGSILFRDGANTLLTLTDTGTIGTLDVSGDLLVTGDNIDSVGGPLVLNLTAADEVRVGGGAPGVATGDGDLYVTDAIEADGAGDFGGTVTAADFACTDCLDFTEFSDSLALDASTSIDASTFTLSMTQNAGSILDLFTITTSAPNVHGLFIDANADAGDGVTEAGGGAFHIANGGNTGVAFSIHSDADSTVTGDLMVLETSDATFDESMLFIQNEGTGESIFVRQGENTGSQNNATDGGAVHIMNTFNDDQALTIYSNNSTSSSDLIEVHADHASFANDIMTLRNDGIGGGIALDLNGEVTAADAFLIDQTVTYTAGAPNITGSMIDVTRSLTADGGATIVTETGPFMSLVNNGATANGGILTYTGAMLLVDQNYTSYAGPIIDIQNAATGGGSSSIQIATSAVASNTIDIDGLSLTSGRGIFIDVDESLTDGTGAPIYIDYEDINVGGGTASAIMDLLIIEADNGADNDDIVFRVQSNGEVFSDAGFTVGATTNYYDGSVTSTGAYSINAGDSLSIFSGGAGDISLNSASGLIYTTNGDDFSVGSTNIALASFAVDVSTDTVYIGDGAGSNGGIIFKANDGDVGNIDFTSNDRFDFNGADVLFTQRVEAASHVDGVGLKLPLNGGVPVAVVGTEEGDIVWDSLNDFLYVYTGGAFDRIRSGDDIDLDTAYDNDANKILNIDTSDLEFSADAAGLDFIVDLQSTGDFIIQDAGTAYFTASDTGTLTQTTTGTGITAFNMTADTVTSGRGLQLNVDGLTTGAGLEIIHNSSSLLSSADVVRITYSPDYDTAGAIGGSGAVLDIARNITVDGATLTQSAPVASFFSGNPTVTSGSITDNSSVVTITQSNTNANAPVLQITSSGADSGLFIDQNSNVTALEISGSNSTTDVVYIDALAVTTGSGIQVVVDSSLNADGAGIDIDYQSTSTTDIAFRVQTDTDSADRAAFVVENDGDTRIGRGALCLDNDGTCAGATDGTIYYLASSVGASDLAEVYASNEVLVAGDIVVIDPTAPGKVRKSSVAYDGGQIAAVATNPATLMGSAKDDELAAAGIDPAGPPTWGNYHLLPGTYPIALAGRIPVKVSASNGSINVGDLITASSTPGVGMRSTQPGAVVGRALEAFAGPGEGMIEVFVMAGWHSGGTIATDGSMGVFNDDFAFASIGEATAGTPGVDSHTLTFRGSGWNGAASQTVGMVVSTDVTDSANYQLSVKNSAGAEAMRVTQSGDLAISGRLYPSDQGTLQTSKYIFYDGAGDYMRTNAAGWATGSYDFAEMFPSLDPVVAGEVVVFANNKETVKRSTGTTYDRTIVGVVSTRPGFLAGESKKGHVPIALAGRVPTFVSGENGAIKPGDPLTTSTKAGYAMKATKPGPIIGYAMEAFSGTTGSIIVFVRSSYYDGGALADAPAAANTSSGVTTASTLDVSGTLNMNGGNIINVGSIMGIGNQWVIEDDGDFFTKGRIVHMIRSYQNEDVETYAVTSRETTIQLSGTATLSNGLATVEFEKIDPLFNDVIGGDTYRVFLTANGPTQALYAVERTNSGFRIIETNGSSTANVDWLVVAYHKDFVPQAPETPIEEPVVAEPIVESVPTESATPALEPIDVMPADPEPVLTPEPVTEEPVANPTPVESPVEPVPEPTPTEPTVPVTEPDPTPVVEPAPSSEAPAPVADGQ